MDGGDAVAEFEAEAPGSAEKKQVQYMVKQLLNLEKVPRPDDAADALAIAVCHAHSAHFTDVSK